MARDTGYALDVDRTFGDLMQRMMRWPLGWVSREEGGDEPVAWIPSIDVFTRGEDLVIRAELPGIDPERDVEITVQDGMLVIRGERRREDRVEESGRYYRAEVVYGSFLRTVPLPQGARIDDISARYEDGILEITVPKGAGANAGKRVPVEASQHHGEQTEGNGNATAERSRGTRESRR